MWIHPHPPPPAPSCPICNHIAFSNFPKLINTEVYINLYVTKGIQKAYLALGKDEFFITEVILSLWVKGLDITELHWGFWGSLMLHRQLFKSQGSESGTHFLLISVINWVSWDTPGWRFQHSTGMEECRKMQLSEGSSREVTRPRKWCLCYQWKCCRSSTAHTFRKMRYCQLRQSENMTPSGTQLMSVSALYTHSIAFCNTYEAGHQLDPELALRQPHHRQAAGSGLSMLTHLPLFLYRHWGFS